MGRDKVEFADTLRGIAAASVLVSHFLGVFWHRREVVAELTGLPILDPSIVTPFPIDLLDPPIPIWAAFGVGLFFLVSGFVIPFSLERYSPVGFLVARFFRLWPTYFVGALFTAGAIIAGTSIAGTTAPFSLEEAVTNAVLGLRELMGRKSFDGIVWTLEVEVKFYLVAALIAPWIRAGSMRTFIVPWALLAGIVAGAVFDLGLRSLLTGFQFLIFMFAGIALNFAYRGLRPTWQMVAVAVSCTAVFVATSLFGPFGQVSYSVIFFAPLVVFAALVMRPALLPEIALGRLLAKISYPLYVMHGVAGYVLLSLLMQRGWPPGAALLLAVSLALMLAYVVHLTVETPSHAIGRALGRRLSEAGNRLAAGQDSSSGGRHPSN